MQINDENIAWAIRKLSRFRSWKGFPPEDEGVLSRARSFLRLVHNRPVAEIMAEAVKPQGAFDVNLVDWERKGMSPNQIDADWLLDLIEETMEEFPVPAVMRSLYAAKLPPAITVGGRE